MKLTTERLNLRSFTTGDLDALSALLGDPEVMRFSLYGPLSREKVQKYLTESILPHEQEHGFSLYAVEERLSGRVIGYAGFRQQNIDGEMLPELGYRFLKDYWGQGLATEAAMALAHYGFDVLHFDPIISVIEQENTRSIRVAQRLGMHFWKETLFFHLPAQVWRLQGPPRVLRVVSN